MSHDKLYAVAIFAMYSEQRRETKRATHIDVPVTLEACSVFAGSHDEARDLGLEKARELWPISDGWLGHTARVAEMQLRAHASTVEDCATERIM